jgi:hypothetical protein
MPSEARTSPDARLYHLTELLKSLSKTVEGLTTEVAGEHGKVLAKLGTTLDVVDRELRALMTLVRGNGVQGLVQRVAALEEKVESRIEALEEKLEEIIAGLGSVSRNRVHLWAAIIAAVAAVTAATIASWTGVRGG